MTNIELSDKFKKALKENDWYNELRFFVEDKKFDAIFQFLIDEYIDGHRFTPNMSRLTKPFQLTPYKDVKAIIIIDEPFNKMGYADGLCMSTLIRDPKEPLTHHLQNAVYNCFKEFEWHCKLDDWAKKGVLLLNKSLTARIDSPNKHIEIWKPFHNFVIDVLNKKDNLVWALIGEETQKIKPFIFNESHSILTYSEIHTDRYYKNDPKWDGINIFNEINVKLNEKKVDVIQWMENA